MKLSVKLGAVAVAALMGAAAMSAQAPGPMVDTNPGIVMAGSYDASKLPAEAHKFLNRHFKGATVTKCEQFYAKGQVEVELSNGVDVDFDLKGKVQEVDAADGTYLPDGVVKELLHRGAYDRLAKDGYAGRVEAIEFNKKGKAVEVDVDRPDPDTYIFDLNGVLLVMED